MRTTPALEIAKTSTYSLEDKIDFHLALSFGRPVLPTLAPILCELVRRFDAGGTMHHDIELPSGMTYKGSTTMVAWELFCAFHLSYFIQYRRDTLPS